MWLSDVRYALRLLRTRPAFTTAAIVTLALGLGANTAMFSVIRAVLLRPLPYASPDRLVRVTGFDRATGEQANLSPADFFDFARATSTLERFGAHGYVGFLTVVDPRGEPERVGGVSVTEGFFPTLGAGFALGRAFTPEEDRPDGPRAVVLGHAFWQRRYGADPGVIGRTILVNQQQTTIVGVLDARFRHVELNPEREADMFVPYRFDTVAPNRGGHFIRAVGRLARGATPEAARAELVALAQRLEQEYPRDNTNRSVVVQPLFEAIVEDARPALLMLAAAVAFVLLVACANLANLLLAHGAGRRGEMAVRVALGAPRARLIRQLLIESVTLSAAGAVAGVALAFLAMPLLGQLQSAGVPGAADIRLDAGVFAFTVVVAIVTGLAIGLLPALQFSRDVHATVRESARGLARGGMRQHARELLIASQMALALVLLAGAGLMLRSLWQLQQVETGFTSDHVLTFETALSTATYAEGEQIPFYERFYDRIRTLPGVASVGAINILPLSANYDSRGVQIEAAPAPAGQAPSIQARSISPDYFSAMNVPLLAGRAFNERDRADTPLVAIVSAAMAKRYWPGTSAIGQRITFNSGIPREAQRDVGGPGSREIVGVVGDVKHLGLDEAEVPMFYTPQAQQPSYHTMAVVVRTSGDPASVTAAAIRAELAALDASVPLYRVRTLDDLLHRVTAAPRMQTWLLGIFAALALVLAAVGVYGVVGYVAGQRTQEIALRLALGAEQRTVLTWILWEGLRPVALGLAVGVVVALATTRLMAGMLFQTSSADAPTFVLVVTGLLAIAGAAVWVPARRAATVNPMDALRSD